MFFYASLCVCHYYTKHVVNPVTADQCIKHSYNWACNMYFKCYVFTFLNKQMCNKKKKPVLLFLGVFQ